MNYSGYLYSSSPSTLQWDPLNKDSLSTKNLDYGYLTLNFHPTFHEEVLVKYKEESSYSQIPHEPKYLWFFHFFLSFCLSPVCVLGVVFCL